MKTEMITGKSIGKYLHILTNEEIFGFNEDRFTLIGAFDENQDQPVGMAAARVMPQYIWLERIFIDPDYRLQGVSKELLRIMTDLPKESRIPFCVYGEESEINENYLMKIGFKDVRNSYSYIEGTLGHLIDIKLPSKRSNIKIQTVDRIAPERLEKFIFASRKDEFLQFPEGYLDMDRFSDASLVCVKDDKIDAVVMMEELTDCIQVTYVYGKSNHALLFGTAAIKKLMLDEFEPSMKLRFLICDGLGREAVKCIFSECEEVPIKMFKWGI